MRKSTKARMRIIALGDSLSDMVMPNIGAFIAWGLMSSMFSRTGWIPNAALNDMVNDLGRYLLPIMLGFTGGKMTGGQRGGLVASIATLGLVAAMQDIALIGAMIIGPLSGWLTKYVDEMFRKRVRQGFELLVNNFSAGIMGIIMSIIAFFGLAPLIEWITHGLAFLANWLINAHLIPLANVIIEPAKVFFLNNAINHGILNPIGIDQAARSGKSLLFLLETNPGPGLGILIAFALFGTGHAKKAAPGAMVIHALGGIHEIYFPYVLKRPLLLLAVMAGGVAGTATFDVLGVGLRADPAPGSIISILLLTPASVHNYFGVLLGFAISTAVSFGVAAVLMPHSTADLLTQHTDFKAAPDDALHIIVTGTDGMGSPAMGARILQSQLRERGSKNYVVTSEPINRLGNTRGAIIFVRSDLVQLVREQAPDAKDIIGVRNYLRAEQYTHFSMAH
jgi:PTS system mannitol-specific IIC component